MIVDLGRLWKRRQNKEDDSDESHFSLLLVDLDNISTYKYRNRAMLSSIQGAKMTRDV